MFFIWGVLQCVYVCAPVRVCMCVCVVHVCVCIYVHMNACMYVCMNVCIPSIKRSIVTQKSDSLFSKRLLSSGRSAVSRFIRHIDSA